MKPKEERRQQIEARRQRVRLAGLCIRCMGNRTAEPGHTADRCASCSEKNRNASRERMRKKRGTPIDLPLVPRVRGPRPNLMSLVNRSDEYKPETYTRMRPGQRKVQPVDADTGLTVTQRAKKEYGSLSREDIRAAPSALPLRPPGK